MVPALVITIPETETMYYVKQGPGHLPKGLIRKAEELGADAVNYTDAPCKCGRSCEPHTCKASRRHWITIEDHGSPIDDKKADEILKKLGLSA